MEFRGKIKNSYKVGEENSYFIFKIIHKQVFTTLKIYDILYRRGGGG